MPLKPLQKRYLRGLAHSLKPVVIVGSAGLTQSVLDEIELSIAHHELMKVRINAADREARQSCINSICEKVGTELVTSIGHIAVLYRAAREPIIKLPR